MDAESQPKGLAAKPPGRAVLNVRFWDRSMSGGAAELGRLQPSAPMPRDALNGGLTDSSTGR